MKRCPKCNNAYTDDSLNFCLQDGTPLESTRYNPEAETLEVPVAIKPGENKLRIMIRIEIEDNLDRLQRFNETVERNVRFSKGHSMAVVQRSDALRSEPLPAFSSQRWESTPTTDIVEALNSEEIQQVYEFYKQIAELSRLKKEMVSYDRRSDWRKDFEALLTSILEKGNPLK